jgi:cytidine deaminase
MVERQISTKIVFCTLQELPEAEKMLVEKAMEISRKAYAPYSRFKVGAACLLANGQVVAANNQENAAYPSGTCAERCALFFANANYPSVPVEAIAIAAHHGDAFTLDPITPCGNCRQVLVETERRFGVPMKVLMYGERDIAVVDAAADLLPLSFGSETSEPLF